MKLNNKNIFIFFSFFIFFVSALHSNFGYLKSKDYPNGYDNHFAYLIKSTNLKYCFFKYSCKGLQSIENQILEKKEENLYNHQIERFSAQIFKIYHPFYSFFIMMVDHIFNDILKSRIFSHLIFLVIVGVSIFFFSKKLFGYNVSCFLLITFAFNNYHGWGYGSQINPFVLSQAFAMLVFVFLLNSSYVYSTFLSILSSLTHPIGIFTNLISILYISNKNFKHKFFEKIFLILVNLSLILYLFFNKSSFYNEIEIGNSSIFSKDTNIFSLIVSNIDKFFYAYEPMIKYYGLPLLMCCSFFFIFKSKDTHKILLIALIFLMSLATIILDKPNVTLPQRFMNITGIVLLGSFFYTFFFLLNKFKKRFLKLKFKRLTYKNLKYSQLENIFNYIPTYFLLIFIVAFFSNIIGGIKIKIEYDEYFKSNHNVSFSKKQLSFIEPKSTIIFDNFEKADYFYLLNGMQKENFIYYDKFYIEEDVFSKNNSKYYVRMSNLYEKNNDSDIFIYPKEKILFHSNGLHNFYIVLETHEKSKIKLNNNVIEFGSNNIINSKSRHSIDLIKNNNSLEVIEGKIKLVSFNNDKKFNWPWNKGSNFEILKKNKHYKIKFDDQIKKITNCKTKVINDDGSSYLYKLINCKNKQIN